MHAESKSGAPIAVWAPDATKTHPEPSAAMAALPAAGHHPVYVQLVQPGSHLQHGRGHRDDELCRHEARGGHWCRAQLG